MQLGLFGLGRMGSNMVRRAMRFGHECVVYNRSAPPRLALAREGAIAAESLEDWVRRLARPRVAWLMLPAAVVDSTLDELSPERTAAREAITQLRLTPVMFELGARPYPPRDVYRAYLAQSDAYSFFRTLGDTLDTGFTDNNVRDVRIWLDFG